MEQWLYTHLNHFKKFHQPQRSIGVGDLVLIKDSDLFIRSWPLARVTQTHPGEDGLACVVTVKTQKGTYRRAIHKLVPLLEESHSLSPPGDVWDWTPRTTKHYALFHILLLLLLLLFTRAHYSYFRVAIVNHHTSARFHFFCLYLSPRTLSFTLVTSFTSFSAYHLLVNQYYSTYLVILNIRSVS